MRIFRIFMLAALVSMMGALVWAQSPGPAPALSKRERIELCKKKQGTPLEPSATPPLNVDENAGFTRPRILRQVKPQPTGTSGRAVVEAVIDEDGCVRQARVLQSGGKSMDDEAVRSIEQWVFLPATRNGHPVSVFYVLTFNARID
jgi:TonB family protein